MVDPVRYDRIPGAEYYLCRQCWTHIALLQEALQINLDPYQGPLSVVVRNADNVVITEDENEHFNLGDAILGLVHCADCGACLGRKCFRVNNPAAGERFREGMIELVLTLLLFWDATKYQIMYAHSHQPWAFEDRLHLWDAQEEGDDEMPDAGEDGDDEMPDAGEDGDEVDSGEEVQMPDAGNVMQPDGNRGGMQFWEENQMPNAANVMQPGEINGMQFEGIQSSGSSNMRTESSDITYDSTSTG